jgi:hypothetical protein
LFDQRSALIGFRKRDGARGSIGFLDPPWARAQKAQARCYARRATRWQSREHSLRKGWRMIDFNNKGFFKLKQNNEYAERVTALLLDGEQVIDAYKSMRDGVVFTNKRIIAVNVQGITGSKKDFTSLPYKNIVAYSVETSGTFDLDSELEIYFSALGRVKFEFTGRTSMVEISKLISQHLLG